MERLRVCLFDSCTEETKEQGTIYQHMWVGLVVLYQIILKFYSYLGQGRNQTHHSVQHRQRSEKRKEQKLTAGIHPFTL